MEAGPAGALEAAHEGQFTTVERVCRGEELYLNYQTERGGWIKVAVVDKPRTPPQLVPELEGFGMEPCDVLEGDELSRQVTWKGSGDLSDLKGREVSVRIRMAKARLFSMGL